MKIWNHVQSYLPSWFSTSNKSEGNLVNREVDLNDASLESNDTNDSGSSNVDLAKESLSQLLADTRVPDSVREILSDEYQQLQKMLEKLEQGHLHISVFGRVSVGKSSVLNALLGKDVFSVSILHGETKTESMKQWQEVDAGGVFLIDTPGINEIDGEAREKLAHEVANRSDLLLFVIDSDLTDVELNALQTVAETQRPIILVVNKADQYNEDEILELRTIIRKRVKGLVSSNNIVFTAALPAQQTVIMVDEDGNETETVRQQPRDILQLKSRVWEVVEAEGKTLSALNASLFAGNISEQLGEKLLSARQDLGQETIHMYCVGKGVAVALNPIPVADLLAAAAIDVSMVIHLSKIYGLPMSKSEAGELIKTIAAQMLVLYATFWAIHFASSALKIGTAGISTVVTGLAQGAVAWYSTLVVGKVAEDYLAKGKSWGDTGPKLTVQNILDSLDKDSVMSDAKEEITNYLKASKKSKKA